ncbi:defensin-like protein 181 [Fagus crenata]
MWLLVEAEICWEDLGVCDRYCSLECNSRHPGGLGSCNQTLAGVPLCICNYECPPPSPQKRCNMGLGRCSSNCKDKCCADKCATKYPGGIGFCDDISGFQYSLCQCQYDC